MNQRSTEIKGDTTCPLAPLTTTNARNAQPMCRRGRRGRSVQARSGRVPRAGIFFTLERVGRVVGPPSPKAIFRLFFAGLLVIGNYFDPKKSPGPSSWDGG